MLTNLIPRYTAKPEDIIALVHEIDDLIFELTTTGVRTFIKLLENRIEVHVNKLKHSEELFKQAQAITHIGNYVWDLTSNKLIWSDELYRIYGLTPGTLITNEIVAARQHPDDLFAIRQHIQQSKQTLAPFDFHYRIIVAQGIVKTLHTRGEVIADKEGKAVTIIGTAQDVTGQKLIEEKLLENQAFIRKIADATPAIIASYNVETGKYVFISHGVKNLLGYDPQKCIEEGVDFFMRLIHPDDLTALLEKNAQAMQQANKLPAADNVEAVIEFQYRMLHLNGEYRWFHTFGTVFNRNERNEVEHVLNISLDITERIKAEQVLYQRTLELQQSNASLEEFAFVASHDLKEPLRKISTFTDRLLMSQRANFDEEGLAVLEKIMSSSLRMQQMINDLLSLSMISGDKSFKLCSLQKLWQEVLISFEHKIEETKAEIKTDDLPEAFVVASQFRQLFQNLLANSLKFTRKDISPVITLTQKTLSHKDVASYKLKEAEYYIQLQFSDNGIGFDNMYVEKIFAIFQRLHHRDSYEGTGIGLAVCKKIIENHGGVIFASGVPNQGSTFTMIFPVKP